MVASNLNADILPDLDSALAGNLGLAASANLNPGRRFPRMFEPVHGAPPRTSRARGRPTRSARSAAPR
ncbi:isocitrate/isopropylmalate family dehydrogenase [Streptomyces rishiriensis]|uniref:Isocitrate/isopropylmalate dehydrogenase n=1 Tax=Streptomyces rishiriensis TaxID=68264 RepID=A0ABU0NHX4_STRRH|nr:isocitrate/isopropylmalate family dehydrogenase [Streptomyces rishiriensis]MDQ0578718.1 isocitrate/isopropylmalate dehydrogenase [Streptomyces rishiriensis]